MNSMLGKALLTTVGALAVAGLAAPAHAEVAAGGQSGFMATADEPALVWHNHFWAETDDISFMSHDLGWATSTALGGTSGFESSIDG